ncbi:MAG: energy-coupling factor ABC transporter ATP-binding protein [Gemmataceae bacterium]|nr:energy-coupling factor ABC transporter ATP-binding protein [Gemmataceae bacterium]
MRCRCFVGLGLGTAMNDGPAIRVAGLSFKYAGGVQALQEICFDVAAGEAVGVIGPNGAGKSTLFLCLAGVLPIAAGVATVAGLDPVRQRRLLPTKVGLVFQNSDEQLFAATVGDDVAFGPLNLRLPAAEVRNRVAEALAKVGLVGFESRVPHHLSGGEKRRTALAGVLAMRPEVLLLDEPSMFLDPRGRKELLQLLRSLGGTQLIASHDLDFILDRCSRVLLLDRGRLIADGPTATVLSDAALVEAHGLEVPYRLRR